MKKLFLPLALIFIFVSIIIFSSCVGDENTAAVPKPIIGSEIAVHYMQADFTALMTEDESGSLLFEISEPQSIKGIGVKCSEDGVAVICGNMRLDVGDGYYPFERFREIYKMINENEPLSANNSGGKITLEYDGFTVKADSETNTAEKIIAGECVYDLR